MTEMPVVFWLCILKEKKQEEEESPSGGLNIVHQIGFNLLEDTNKHVIYSLKMNKA